jgi:predicted transglutaminase-like cysteine proteinase
MTEDEIEDIAEDVHRKVSSLADYTSDSEEYGTPDDWRDHYQEVADGLTFKDDCDGTAWTYFVACLEAGIPPARVSVNTCCVEPFTDNAGVQRVSLADRYHMVCTVNLDDRSLVLDNRQSNVWHVGELHEYTWSLPKDDRFHSWFKNFNAATKEWTTTGVVE